MAALCMRSVARALPSVAAPARVSLRPNAKPALSAKVALAPRAAALRARKAGTAKADAFSVECSSCKKAPKPKLKTRRAAAKRFRATATGKIVRRGAGKQHINEHMQKKTKKKLRKNNLVFKGEFDNVYGMLPYLK